MNKDEQLDRLLRRSAAPAADERSSGGCLDAETLAAWTDGRLPAAQSQAVEAHAADCPRCLAVVAALSRTAPPPDARASRPAWLSVRWLVPLTTAAVAVTAWVLVQGPAPAPAPTPSAPPPLESAGRGEPAPVVRQDQPSRSSSLESHKQEAVSGRAEDRAKSRARAGAPSAETVVTEKAAPPASAAARDMLSAAAPASPPPPPEARVDRFAEVRIERQNRASGSTPRVIVSPDPVLRWRIAGPALERSTDGGQTWRTEVTGTAVDLRDGSSPARNICWIVGRAGTVLLSVDGRTWRRLDFPDATVDLVGVDATDAEIAAVTTADGRTYRTSNAGRTWTLQENPAAPF